MAILNYPAWPFEPNWSSTMTETLEWLTDVMASPSGSEQRRTLRYLPRQTFEYTLAASGEERSLLDNLLVTYGAQRWYMPLWHDVNLIEQDYDAGATFLQCASASTSRLQPGSIGLLMGESPYDVELIEIQSVSLTGVTLVSPTAHVWPQGTRLLPAKVARLTDQPRLSKRSDRVVTSDVRFQVLEAPHDPGAPSLTESYRGFFVMSSAPDDRAPLDHSIERTLVELDNQTAAPIWQDTAGRPFTYEQFAWVIKGRDELQDFEALIQLLRGRAIPLWIPTFMEDFRLSASIAGTDNTILVERCGFTQSGGPRWDRQDIMIETISGHLYRRILDAAVDSSGREVLLLDAAIAGALTPDQVVRISFMTLMRQNQDSISIEHATDTDGVATAQTIFRSAPDTRVPTPAF